LPLGSAGAPIHLVEALPDLGRHALSQVDLPSPALLDENHCLELRRRGCCAHPGGIVLDRDLELLFSGHELPEHKSTERVIVFSLPVREAILKELLV
jgi:hypothetical protein